MFTGPHDEQVPELMRDLAEFAVTPQLPPSVSVAIAHAQFEIIHPLSDRNGRTAGAMAQAMLRHKGATWNVAVPVSAGLLANVEGYHDALTAYQSGDVAPIVQAFAHASLRAVHDVRQLVAEIDEIREG